MMASIFFLVLFVWDQSFFTSGIKKHDGSEVLMVIPKVTAVQAVNNKQYSVLYRVLTTSGRGSFHIIFLCKCMLMCEVPALKIKLNYVRIIRKIKMTPSRKMSPMTVILY